METKKRKEPMGDPNVKDAVIDWISEGKTLREFCRQEGMPSYRAIYRWLEDDEEFASRFAQARDIGADVIAEEALAIINEEAELCVTENSTRRDAAHVAWLKNRAEFRLKLLAKWNPKKYGDKLDVTSKGEQVGLAINIDLK